MTQYTDDESRLIDESCLNDERDIDDSDQVYVSFVLGICLFCAGYMSLLCNEVIHF